MLPAGSNKSRASAIVEYVVLITLVAAALAAMNVYMKRGLQGVVKVTADQLGPQQYQYQQTNPNGAPIYFMNGQTESMGNSTSRGTIGTIVSNGGTQTKTIDTDETITSSSNSNSIETGD